MNLLRYLAFWFVLAVVAIANGTLRQFVYGPWMTELTAHQLSTLTGILFTGLAVAAFHRRYPIPTARQAVSIGAAWLAMTIAFEFGFGHYVAGHPWQALLADYNLAAGRLWALFLAWIALLPTIVRAWAIRGT
jgi:hypothetical protein